MQREHDDQTEMEDVRAESYLAPEHPHQRKILATIASVCGLDPRNIHIGVDGCGAPIHYIRVRDMALGYARMSRPE